MKRRPKHKETESEWVTGDQLDELANSQEYYEIEKILNHVMHVQIHVNSFRNG